MTEADLLVSLQDLLGRVAERVRTAGKDQDALLAMIADEAGRISALAARTEALEGRQAALGAHLEEASSVTTALRSTVPNLQARLEEVGAAVARVDGEVKQFATEVKAGGGEIGALRDTMARFGQATRALEEQLTAWQEEARLRIAGLEEREQTAGRRLEELFELLFNASRLACWQASSNASVLDCQHGTEATGEVKEKVYRC